MTWVKITAISRNGDPIITQNLSMLSIIRKREFEKDIVTQTALRENNAVDLSAKCSTTPWIFIQIFIQ